jgi:hypothetical protein
MNTMSSYHSPPPRYDPAPDSTIPRKSEVSEHAYTQPNRRTKASLLDELLPLPSHTSTPIALPTRSIPLLASKYLTHVLRRTLSLAIVFVFLLSTIFLASTQEGKTKGSVGLKKIFGVGEMTDMGGASWVAEDIGDPTKGDDDLTSAKGEFESDL